MLLCLLVPLLAQSICGEDFTVLSAGWSGGSTDEVGPSERAQASALAESLEAQATIYPDMRPEGVALEVGKHHSYAKFSVFLPNCTTCSRLPCVAVATVG